MKNVLKPLDFVFALLILLIAAAIYLTPSYGDAKVLSVYVDGKLTRSVDLKASQEHELEVASEFGCNKIIIQGGRARVAESTCENKLEIKAGEIYKAGQSLICIPNRLVVIIEGKDEYDAVTY